MKTHLSSLIYGITATVLVVETACSPVSINRIDTHIRGTLSTPDTIEAPSASAKGDVAYNQLQYLADRNERALQWYREKELTLYQGEKYPHAIPQRCLALSGGGIRAAAYSIGVMKGLQHKGILENIDIISSVSGGAYALSWFYVQSLKENTDPPQHPNNINKIFTESRFINHLVENGDMYTATDILQSSVSNAALIPLNLVANGIFRWNWNTTPARANYEYEIRKLFQRGMVKNLEDTETWVRKNQLPYFIINTTARIDDDKFHHGGNLSKSIFEFTPLRFGSDAFGYGYKSETEFPVTFSEAISISGAAADSSIVAGDTQKALLSTINHNLGFYIDNYTPESKRQNKWWTKFLPFPLYFFSTSSLRDKNSTDIYLSDGGHSENLAAFSLIRRACETIIIVDAEYDPQYKFEAYFKLKDALENEMSVELSIPNIDKIREVLTCRGSRDPLDKACNGLTEKPSGQEFDTSIPVISGKIVGFPIYSENKDKIVQIMPKVIYIKLAIDEKRLKPISNNEALEAERVKAIEDFGEHAVDYYIKSRHGDCGNYILKCAFPQYSTIDQSYTPEQFRAYVDLGYHNVMGSQLIAEQSGG